MTTGRAREFTRNGNAAPSRAWGSKAVVDVIGSAGRLAGSGLPADRLEFQAVAATFVLIPKRGGAEQHVGIGFDELELAGHVRSPSASNDALLPRRRHVFSQALSEDLAVAQ